MELKAGYKQTEVGVIPENWEVTQISAVSDVKTGPFGSSLHERDYVQDGTPIITVEHLSEYGVLHANLPMVSDFDRQRLKAYSLQKNDIVFSRVGSVDRNSLISELEEGWLFSGRLLRIRLHSKNVFAPFLSYYFHDEPFKQRVRSVAVGQTMPSLNTQIINGIEIALPPLPEQHAIAAALSDVDALISALDKLIAKKRDIKQAAMQQLLTGKKRLPGFSGEWEVKKLGEISEVLKGNGLSKNKLTASGSRKCILYGELFTTYQRTITDVVSRTDSLEGKLSKHGDVLMPGSTTTVGIDLATASALLEEGVALGGDINIIRQRDTSYDPAFLTNYLTHVKRFAIAGLAQGITIIHLYGRNLVDLSIELPTLAEQQTIAEVLSDMDAEIATLERKRDKTRALKQGMMQELLTGKTRLL